MPTLVYNCHNLPSICLNLRQRQGSENRVYVFDGETKRKAERRKFACQAGWTNQPRPGTPGPYRCPGVNQPNLVADGLPRDPIVMFQDGSSVNHNRLPRTSIKIEADGTQTTVYHPLGVILSCDEFPPATFVYPLYLVLLTRAGNTYVLSPRRRLLS